MNRPDKPFANLGKHLRNVREQASRSLAEVSGAIEIEEQALKLIETGQERPEEEVHDHGNPEENPDDGPQGRVDHDDRGRNRCS